MDNTQDASTHPVEEPELPQLPPKRPHVLSMTDFLAGTSSDPPDFSSDDITPAAENYSSRRKKHRYIAPWWQPPSSRTHPRKKRRIQRNYDSGIHMGSDHSFASTDIPSSELDRLSTYAADDWAEGDLGSRSFMSSRSTEPNTGEKRKSPSDDEGGSVKRTKPSSFRLTLSKEDPAGVKRRALEIVETAVETGNETIDLNGALVWSDKSGDTSSVFHPLHHMIKTRQYDDPSRYEELVPDLRLYLNANNLEALPAQVYKLVNLTELGLWNNKLETLEPFVDNLSRLHRLNLRANRIRWLPLEVTRLPYLHELYFDDEHLVKAIAPGSQNSSLLDPTDELSETRTSEWFQVENELTRGAIWRSELVRWTTHAVSQISYMDRSGRRVPGSPERPSECSVFRPSKTEFVPAERFRETAGVKTLLELAVAKASEAIQPHQWGLANEWFGDIYGSGEEYEHLQRLLEQAKDVQEKGQKRCFCGRTYVVARAEWIEWSVFKRIMTVPLLARACSWKCASDRMAEHKIPTGDSTVLTQFGWEW